MRAIVGGVERFAIARVPNTIQCDFPGCQAQHTFDRVWGVARGRARAAGQGWTQVEGVDLCPKHGEHA